MGEIIFVVLLAGGFLIPTAIFKQWWLFKVFSIFFVIFGLVEWWAVASTGMSVSQHFWKLDEVNPTAGWIIVGGMGVGWAALLWHFKARKKK
jgi:hypothetical protein